MRVKLNLVVLRRGSFQEVFKGDKEACDVTDEYSINLIPRLCLCHKTAQELQQRIRNVKAFCNGRKRIFVLDIVGKSLRMSVTAFGFSVRRQIKTGKIIGSSTIFTSFHAPFPRHRHRRYTLKPPITLFIQHNEFICLEGSQLFSRKKEGNFSVVFLAPSGVYSQTTC